MWEFYLAYCEAGFRTRLPWRQPAADDPGAGSGAERQDVAWVVGASSGIGAAVARELVPRRDGRHLAPDARTSSSRSPAASMLVVPADVTDAAVLSAAASRSATQLGPLDVVDPVRRLLAADERRRTGTPRSSTATSRSTWSA